MQNKVKAVKTAFIIVLVLVVLAGAVGVSTVLFKRNNVTSDDSIRIVVKDVEFGNSNSYQFMCTHDTYSKIEKDFKENGYVNIFFELSGIEEKEPLTWSSSYS